MCLAILLLPGSVAPAAEPPPLWSFGWITDMHLDESRREFIARAIHEIGDPAGREATDRPRFVLFTGDNNALPAPPTTPGESLGMRRQRFLKTFLGEHLKVPYALIPGDNWPEDFEKVFGPRQYSFDYGGLHFLLLAPDRSCHTAGVEGLSALDETTKDWIRKDLEASREKPVVVAIHEPIHPCTFLDAPPLRKMLDDCPGVVAVFQGHLHVDMDFRSGGRAYLVAPALGKTPRPAMKLVEVYPDSLVLRTIEYRKTDDRFQTTGRRQTIPIPQALRAKIARPSEPGVAKSNFSAVPSHPHREDPELAKRSPELLKAIGRTLGGNLLEWRP